jgi:hypothetical protein
VTLSARMASSLIRSASSSERSPDVMGAQAVTEPRLFLTNKRGEAGHIDGPVEPLGFFGLAPAAFTGKLFTNATASSSHALSASFVGTGGSI